MKHKGPPKPRYNALEMPSVPPPPKPRPAGNPPGYTLLSERHPPDTSYGQLFDGPMTEDVWVAVGQIVVALVSVCGIILDGAILYAKWQGMF